MFCTNTLKPSALRSTEVLVHFSCTSLYSPLIYVACQLATRLRAGSTAPFNVAFRRRPSSLPFSVLQPFVPCRVCAPESASFPVLLFFSPSSPLLLPSQKRTRSGEATQRKGTRCWPQKFKRRKEKHGNQTWEMGKGNPQKQGSLHLNLYTNHTKTTTNTQAANERPRKAKRQVQKVAQLRIPRPNSVRHEDYQTGQTKLSWHAYEVSSVFSPSPSPLTMGSTLCILACSRLSLFVSPTV